MLLGAVMLVFCVPVNLLYLVFLVCTHFIAYTVIIMLFPEMSLPRRD